MNTKTFRRVTIAAITGTFLFGVLMTLFGPRGNWVLFSNDGPFGAMSSEQAQGTAAYFTSWIDLNWLGFYAGGSPIYYGNLMACNLISILGPPFVPFVCCCLLLGWAWFIGWRPRTYRITLLSLDAVLGLLALGTIILGATGLIGYDSVVTLGVVLSGLFPFMFLLNVFSMHILGDEA